MTKPAQAHSTNYYDTLIEVSPDCVADEGRVPTREGSVALMQYERIAGAPYEWTSDDLVFEIYCLRNGVGANAETRQAFFAKGQSCLRASPLVKTCGWGVHYDAAGRMALVGRGTDRYAQLQADGNLTKVIGMRNRRAGD